MEHTIRQNALHINKPYLALNIGEASGVGWDFLVYFISKPSTESPGTCRSLQDPVA